MLRAVGKGLGKALGVRRTRQACDVCAEPRKLFVTVQLCQHCMCVPCARGAIPGLLEALQGDAPCPLCFAAHPLDAGAPLVPPRMARITQAQLRLLLSRDEFAALVDAPSLRLAAAALYADGGGGGGARDAFNLRPCIDARCSGVAFGNPMQCSVCAQRICEQCGREQHVDGERCHGDVDDDDDEADEDETLCVVCMFRVRDTRFLPCNHCVCCTLCAGELRRCMPPMPCPVCRAEIQN